MVIVVVVVVFLRVASVFVAAQSSDASLSSLLKDPRNNSSYYDVIVNHSGSDNSGTILVGDVANVLLQKGTGPKWDYITKYKLIYYSPQLLPSAAYETTSTHQTKTKQDDNEKEEEEENPLFTINEKNGSIYLHTPPNEPVLEYLCMRKLYCSCMSCIFSLNIIFTSANRVGAETVRVFVDDFNDFAPTFFAQSLLINVNISEASRIGDAFKVINAAAVDSDAYYNKITYQISERKEGDTLSNLYEISPIDFSTSSPSNKDLLIILKSHLDYEFKRDYDLYIIARDNGPDGGKASSIKLHVNVLDENDNSPVCEKSLFMENVRENAIVENFLQIKVTDLDSSLNAKPLFSIVENFGDENLKFSINKDTGWMSVKKELDYETKTYYELTIRVDDLSPRSNFSTYCSARINILDVNDNPAKLKVIKYLNESVQNGYYSLNSMSTTDSVTNDDDNTGYSYSTSQIEVCENNPPHTVLALIRVFDRDSISNYRFSIQSATNSHEDTTMFEMRYADRVNREFELVAKAAFNAEIIQNYRLKIILYDLDADVDPMKDVESSSHESLMYTKRPLLDSIDFYRNNFPVVLFQNVRILDLNDNKPEFVKKIYQFFIDENESNVILRVPPIEVYDVDTSERNSRLHFRIGDKASMQTISDHIWIVEENDYPLVKVVKSFDYETHGDKIEFELIANDVDNLTDTCWITIHVRDLNDNSPMFMNENATFTISENSPPNSFIGQVIAIDRDSSGLNSDISFRIQSEHLRAFFKIYKTGVISNWLPLDRESHSDSFTLHVEAYNTHAPALSRIGIYYIRLEDENDNQPRFVYPRENATRLVVKLPSLESFPNSTNLIRVFDVKAIDEDVGENGRVVYSLDTSTLSPSQTLVAHLSPPLVIDKNNGSVFFNYFAFNITDLRQLERFRATFRIVIGARDSSPTRSLTARPLNLTLYLNYDVKRVIEVDDNDDEDATAAASSPSVSRSTAAGFEFNEIDVPASTAAARNFFQLVSNGVLLIILITVLMFMLFVACFLFIIFYKKNSSSPPPLAKDAKGETKPSKNTNSMHVKSHGNSCLGKMRSSLKKKCSLVKSSSFGNLNTISSFAKKNDNNLTVKDASPNETALEPIIGNSFKVTIKTGDAASKKYQSKFVFDNLNARLNSDNSLAIEKASPALLMDDNNNNNNTSTSMGVDVAVGTAGTVSTSSTSSSSYEDRLCITDFSRRHQCVSAKKIVVGGSAATANSNNSTIIINSLSSPTTSSSSSSSSSRFSHSTMPLRRTIPAGNNYYANPGYIDTRSSRHQLPITSASSSTQLSANTSAATSNTIKFILSSQLAAAAQRDQHASKKI